MYPFNQAGLSRLVSGMSDERLKHWREQHSRNIKESHFSMDEKARMHRELSAILIEIALRKDKITDND